MVIPSAGSIVVVPFPFSDLTQSKFRPALASADRGGRVLCQVTSNPYGDRRAIELAGNDFAVGGLRVVSYARPAKLFTAHESLFTAEAGKLHPASLRKILGAVIAIF